VISAKRWDARTVRTVILEIRASDAVTICRRMGVNLTAGAERTVNPMTETHACDCISRQMLLEYIHGEPVGRLLCDKYNLDGLIEQFPSAQPERKGRWIKLDMHAHLADHKCTACGQECYVPTCMGEPMYTYCPNCGADMRGENGG